MLDDLVGDLVDAYMPPGLGEDSWDCPGLSERLKLQFGYEIHAQNLERMERDEILETLQRKLKELYEKNEATIGPERTRWIEKVLLLQMVDEHWKHHLYLMDDIQEGIGLQGYAGKNPLVEYKIQARDRFNEMIGTIKESVLTHLFHIAVEEAEEVRYERRPRGAGLRRSRRGPQAQAVRLEEGGPQRSLPLRLGQEVQEVLRTEEVRSPHGPSHPRRTASRLRSAPASARADQGASLTPPD